MKVEDINPLSAIGMNPEIVTKAIPEDEREWVPQALGFVLDLLC